MIRSFSAALLLATIGSVTGASAASPALGLHLTPCTQGHKKVPAQCGTFGVYENRAAGRIISLRVIVLKAEHPSHHAIAEIAGGPGESATSFAAFIMDGDFENFVVPLRDRYDVLFVDDRGMGGSNPFPCDFAPAGNPSSYFRRLWPEQLVRDCRTKSVATHDLSLYGTNNAVDDLNDVRAALGYPKLVLDGGSYGTFFSLVYMRRHPNAVESVILNSVSAPHFQPLPGAPNGAQKALDDLIVKCRREKVCNSRFPRFAEHFNAIVRRLDKGTLNVPVKNQVTKRIQTVALSKEVFVDQVRHILYAPQAAAYLPFVIERAYGRDYAPLGQMIDTVTQGFSGDLDMGSFLSYTCAEWMPFINQRQLNFAATHSFAGDSRIRAQQHACSIWSVRPMPPAFDNPVRSNAPVLMLLATDDPATPPQYGEQALRYLPNGRAILVKGAGHGVETPCTDRLVIAFVRAGSAKGLNLSQCTLTFKPQPFATSMKGWP
ncbi:MAG TPA: alpha/beta hydrolase [Verrucomicrobiae bacterium]|nr:alpha/beta hydrolase [Verrucomicrobiae bacterium]